MVNFGVSTTVARETPFEEGLEKIARAGFAQVELAAWGCFSELWLEDPGRGRGLLESKGVRSRTVHSPEAGWDNDAPDDAVRCASVDVASSVFPAVAAMGVETVIVHPNARYTHDFAPGERRANVARSAGSLRALAERAAAHGLRLAVENMPRRGTPRPGGAIEEILEMIDGLGPRVGVCVDTGHANANGLSAADEVRRAAGRVFAVHLQDTDGKGEDQHLLPGGGTVDWPAVLAALERFAPDAACNFEVPTLDGDVNRTLAVLADIAKTWDRMRRGG